MNDPFAGHPEAPEVNAVPVRETVLAGILSGLAGGAAMLVVLAVSTRLAGLGWVHPLEAIGTTLVGPGAAGGAAAIAAGLFLHAVTSAGFGIALALILPDDFPPVSAATVGGACGLCAAGLMMSLGTPAVNPDFRSSIQSVGGSWTIAHVAFGVTLGLALTVRRRATSRAMKRAAPVAGTAQMT